MSSTIVRGKGQITIPADIRRAARLEEGDPVTVELVEEGILLRPHKLIDATQTWFWTRAWQERERAAEEDLLDERRERFESGDELLAALDERMKPLDADV